MSDGRAHSDCARTYRVPAGCDGLEAVRRIALEGIYRGLAIAETKTAGGKAALPGASAVHRLGLWIWRQPLAEPF
ncbi:MAG: hypothetical protein IPL71_22555 [Anaerolineales bacterium]|uniref:hypothetical protein n=1 Tax=Candidatus Villigracilis proximus TaxID=3140683 RepID=UPI003135DA89|nr:hypothetical protein [Anaerolineales bacterium]